MDARCCNLKLMCAVGVSSLLINVQEEWLGQFRPNDTKRSSLKEMAPLCEDANEQQCHVKWEERHGAHASAWVT